MLVPETTKTKAKMGGKNNERRVLLLTFFEKLSKLTAVYHRQYNKPGHKPFKV